LETRIANPDPFPYTNNGFTSGKNNKLGVPEWKMPDANISEGVIYRKKIKIRRLHFIQGLLFKVDREP